MVEVSEGFDKSNALITPFSTDGVRCLVFCRNSLCI